MQCGAIIALNALVQIEGKTGKLLAREKEQLRVCLCLAKMESRGNCGCWGKRNKNPPAKFEPLEVGTELLRKRRAYKHW